MNSRQLITIALVLSLALSGCSGWGADGPAGDDEQNDSNTSDLENASNETTESENASETESNTSSTERQNENDDASSDSASSSSAESTQSETESDDSDSSDSTSSDDESSDPATTQSDDSDESTDPSSGAEPQGSDPGDEGSSEPAEDTSSDDADTSESDTDTDSDSESETDSENDDPPDESDTDSDEGDEGDSDPDPEPENTTITVTLVDSETGDPLDGTVELIFTGWGYGFEKATTDGEVTFSTEEDGLPTEGDDGSDSTMIDYEADVDGYAIEEGTTDFTSTIEFGAENSHTLELVEMEEDLHPLTLTVTVVDQNGEPVEGEAVEWGPGPTNIDESATTDENGEVEITVGSSDPTDVVQTVVEVDGEQKYGSLHSEGGTLEFTVFQETGVLAPNETGETNESTAAA